MREFLISTALLTWTATAAHLGSFHLASFPLFTLFGAINDTLQQVLNAG